MIYQEVFQIRKLPDKLQKINYQSQLDEEAVQKEN